MVPYPSDRPPSAGFFLLRDLPSEQIATRPRKGQSVARITGSDAGRELGGAEAPKAAGAARQAVRWHPSTAPARALSPQMIAGSRAARIVQELSYCGPGAEISQLGPIRGLGTVGLAALARAFPGTLWFDRNEPHRGEPRGRDVSPVASLLFALGRASHPYVIRLLSHEDDDVRFYATLLASDFADRSMLEPLTGRLFDADVATARSALRGIEAIGGAPEIAALEHRLARNHNDASRTDIERARAGELLDTLRR